MIDSVQLILVLVIVILTVLLVVLGIQVYFILKDLRKTIAKANKVLDDAGSIAENVSAPIANLSTVITTLRAGSLLTIAKIIKGLLSRDKDDDSDERRRNGQK